MAIVSDRAARPHAGPLLPIGGGYLDILPGFADAAVETALSAERACLEVVVLPTAYATSAASISDEERCRNLRDAEVRRAQIEAACRRVAPPRLDCAVTLLPIFTRADAHDPALSAVLASGVSAIFMLGGDQTVAMAALAGTPAERAMTAAHKAGAVIAGTSAGGGMLAAEMLGGYNPGYEAANSVDVGAADIWNRGECRGLSFGVQGALLDQHFFQRGRMGRLLNAITTPGAMGSPTPSLGIGIDAYTGARIEDTGAGWRLSDVFGLYNVAVLDAGTYHAVDTAQYTPLEDLGRAPVLSLRNVLVHLLSSGPFNYDLARRCPSLAAPEKRVDRDFNALRLPPGAGTLVLGGDLSATTAGDPVLARFRELVRVAGHGRGRVLVYADGYATLHAARTAAEKLAASLELGALGLEAEVWTAADLDVCCPEDMGGAWLRDAGYSGVALIGNDQSRVDVAALGSWLPALWAAGLPILADNALASVLGACYAAHGPTPTAGEAREAATQRAFRVGETDIRRGLGLVAATFEPQLLADKRWGRFFSLAYTHPELVAVGLNRDAALEIGRDGAWALGENVTFVLDLRQAARAAGTQGGFVVANALLDVFAPGDEVRPQPASTDLMPPAGTLLPQHDLWQCKEAPR